MMLDGFISLITAHGSVGSRVYKSVLPRGYVLPAIAIHRYGGAQDYDYAGPVDVREDQIQIDVYVDAADDTVLEAIRALISGYVGTLPDGTVVQACYLEREMDMPFLPNADTKGIANRSTLGFRVVSKRS
jgi:hypothetical protein